jgi:large conductance mechanosensitive channel
MEISAKEVVRGKIKGQVSGFADFVREQGVIGLAIGFILGGAVSKTVTSLVENIINPLIGAMLGKIDLTQKAFELGHTWIRWGAFASAIVDFVIVAGVVYFGFNALGLKKLDKKKE